ncbi:hypothetical protein AB4212_21415, partial [Streptomyces sp. 2MCAF27]
TNPMAGPAGGKPFGSGSFPGGGSGPGGFELPGGFGGGTSDGTSGGPGGTQPGMPSEIPSGMPGFGSGGNGSTGGMGGPSGLGRLLGGTDLTADQRKILDYAVEHSGSARISLAVEGGANGASTFILNSDATVIGMGGFIGTDNAPSVHQLETWTSKGELRYVLGSDSRSGGTPFGAMAGGDSAASQRSEWISDHCAKVPASAYGGGTSSSGNKASGPTGMMGMATTLYDCAAKK